VFELPLIIGQAASKFWKAAAYISGYPSGTERSALSLANTFFFLFFFFITRCS